MTEKPFVHSKAYANVRANFIYQEDAAKIIMRIVNKKGIINVGGPSQTIYNFAKKNNKKSKRSSQRWISQKKWHEFKKIKKNNKIMIIKKTKFKDLFIIKQKNNSDKKEI